MNNLIEQRTKTHGNFKDNAEICVLFKKLVPNSVDYDKLPPVISQACDYIILKLARACAGDFYYKDHWIDITNYCQFAIDNLTENDYGYDDKELTLYRDVKEYFKHHSFELDRREQNIVMDILYELNSPLTRLSFIMIKIISREILEYIKEKECQ